MGAKLPYLSDVKSTDVLGVKLVGLTRLLGLLGPLGNMATKSAVGLLGTTKSAVLSGINVSSSPSALSSFLGLSCSRRYSLVSGLIARLMISIASVFFSRSKTLSTVVYISYRSSGLFIISRSFICSNRGLFYIKTCIRESICSCILNRRNTLSMKRVCNIS